MDPKVKICCIASIEEARLAIEFGADAIGLVGPMPSGPGVIDDELIAEIASAVKGEVETFLLTSETHAESIIQHHEKVGTSALQIVDAIPNETHSQIRNALPNVKIVQVVHVMDDTSIDQALEAAETADVILLDSGNPSLEVKELGGTGRTHNWRISERIVAQSSKPVFLAGGLNPKNVRTAIGHVNPYGVDLCSGVRTSGILDPSKLKKFFEHARFRQAP